MHTCMSIGGDSAEVILTRVNVQILHVDYCIKPVRSASCGIFFTRLSSLGYLKVSEHTEYSRSIRKILICVKTFF
jgi:hypothetical protein